MHCHDYQQATAIGLSKACNKALFTDYVNDLDYGLACKNKHEQRAANLELMISKSVKTYAEAVKNQYRYSRTK